MRTDPLILTYHAVGDGPPPLSIDAGLFARHLDTIVAAGAPVLTAGELAATRRPGAVAICFDDGFADVARVAAPLLAERGLTATVFCLAELLGDRVPWPPYELARADEIAALAAAGWEIGSHGLAHERLDDLESLRPELIESRRLLAERVGVVPQSFAYPFGAAPVGGRDALADAGYTAAVTTRLALVDPAADPLGLPRVDVHYVRRPSLLRALLDGRIGPYLGARALASRARRLVRA